jgi:hypothetical protein
MVPILAYATMALVGYLIEQKTEELRTAAEREKRQLRYLKARRARVRREARTLARGAAIAAANKMIEILKAERRTAAQARDQLLWGSEERNQAQELVVILSQRLDVLYSKTDLYAKQSP